MKKIVLHGSTVDSVGNFVDSGTELEISDKAKPGAISAEAARDLVDSGRAVSATASAEIEKAAAQVQA